jgi:GH25 family lysozyme M1 (1,4-beta-N-acetylmuramidase)
MLAGLALTPVLVRGARAQGDAVAGVSEIVLGEDGHDEDDRSALADFDAQNFGPPATRGPSVVFEYPRQAVADAVYGVDVSHHNGTNVDWAALAASGISFAYIKASQSDRARDRRFEANWKGANDAGLAVGAYHFLSAGVPAADQANYFLERLQAVGGLVPGKHLHPAVDIEWDEYGKDFVKVEVRRDENNKPIYRDFWQAPVFEGTDAQARNRQARSDNADAIASELRAFVDGVSNGLKPMVVKPMIYTINSWWNARLLGPRHYHAKLADIAFWPCDVRQSSYNAGAPEYPSGVAFKVWQFSSSGLVVGSDGTRHGPFDCNKLHDVSVGDMLIPLSEAGAH